MTEDNIIESEFRSHFNEPVIVGFDLCRCVGYAEDDTDCYMIYKTRRGEKRYSTAVGGYHFLNRLRGQNQVTGHDGKVWDDLFRLDSSLEFNGCTREPEFLVERI